MKKRGKFVFIVVVLLSACFLTCNFENPVMETWWQEESEDPEYVTIFKNIPKVIVDRIVDKQIVYQTVFVDLPPEVIKEYIYEELPPKIIYETIIKYETIYVDVIKEIEVYITLPPTKEEIIQYIKDNPEEIITLIRETEILYETLKEIIIRELTEEELKEIIKNIPPEKIIEYLTDEQIKYIVSQQPPEVILQSISIIGIEYIIFSGNSTEYNGKSPILGGTDLTAEETRTNDLNVNVMVSNLTRHSNYVLILHGHANPTVDPSDPNWQTEVDELNAISLARANAVADEMLPQLPPGFDKKKRMNITGYGGEKNISGSTTYAGLNRRVELILISMDVIKQ